MNFEGLTKKQLIDKIKTIEKQNSKLVTKVACENEELYRVLFDSSKDAIMTLAPPTWNFTSGNRAILEMFRVKTIEEFTGLGPWAVSPENQPDGRKSNEKAQEMIQAAMEKGSNYFEWTHKRMNGETFPATVLLSRVDMPDNVLLQATVRDISNEQRVLKSLKESEDRFRSFFNQLGDAVFVTSVGIKDRGKILEVNPAAEKQTGYSRAELLDMNIINDSLIGVSKELSLEREKRVLNGEVFQAVEEKIRKDGRHYWVEVVVSLIDYNSSSALLAINRDITERKQAEIDLNESIKKFKDLFENMNDGFGLHKIILNKNNNPVDYQFLEVNPILANRIGMKPEDLINKRALEIFPKTEKYWIETFGRVALTGKPEQFTNYSVEADQYYEVRAYSPQPGYFAALFTDVTERLKAEQALRDEKEITETALNSQQDTFFLFEPDTGKAVRWNRSLREISGYSDEEIAKMKAPDSYYGDEDLKRAAAFIPKVIENGFGVISLDLICKDGQKIPTEYSVSTIKDEHGAPKYFISIGRDITAFMDSQNEKIKLEKQLRRSQKMETIGTLAGGIAHDFNNVLAPIMGYTEMALTKLDESDTMHRYLSNVLKASFRAKDLVEQILLFSKQSEKERKAVHLQTLIKEALRLLRPSIPTTIEIKQKLDRGCSKVIADSSQIHQIILNLCTNAWHAMQDRGGTLSIILEQVSVESKLAKFHPNLQHGEYACLSIIDTGFGMSEKTLEHIFEPFFTTKSVDQGTGLGLSVVHGIVLSHKGDIVVNSVLGKGSSFKVYLPIAKADYLVSEKPEKIAIHGTERVMIVDDEPAIEEMLKLMLESYGYKADVFETCEKAVKEFRKDPAKYDILISDLTMPRMTGLELADQIHHLRADLPIVIITGYGDKLPIDTLHRYGIKQVLNKPIIAKDLAIAIREVLDN